MKGNTTLTTDGLHFDEYKKLLDVKTASISWDSIEETEPDEVDLQMLSEIENDPDCNEFVPASELLEFLRKDA